MCAPVLIGFLDPEHRTRALFHFRAILSCGSQLNVPSISQQLCRCAVGPFRLCLRTPCSQRGQPPAPRRGLPLYNFSRLLSNRLELPRPSGPAGLGACGGLLGSLSNGLKLNYANSDDPPPRPLLCLLHRADLASWRGPARWVSSRSGWLGAF